MYVITFVEVFQEVNDFDNKRNNSQRKKIYFEDQNIKPIQQLSKFFLLLS